MDMIGATNLTTMKQLETVDNHFFEQIKNTTKRVFSIYIF